MGRAKISFKSFQYKWHDWYDLLESKTHLLLSKTSVWCRSAKNQMQSSTLDRIPMYYLKVLPYIKRLENAAKKGKSKSYNHSLKCHRGKVGRLPSTWCVLSLKISESLQGLSVKDWCGSQEQLPDPDWLMTATISKGEAYHCASSFKMEHFLYFAHRVGKKNSWIGKWTKIEIHLMASLEC